MLDPTPFRPAASDPAFHAACRRAGLKGSAKAVFEVVWDSVMTADSVWPTNFELARCAGRTVDHTRRLVAQLEKRGLIRRVSFGAGYGRGFEVVGPEPAAAVPGGNGGGS